MGLIHKIKCQSTLCGASIIFYFNTEEKSILRLPEENNNDSIGIEIIAASYHKDKTTKMETKSWKGIKDKVYGQKGTVRRDALERDFESFKMGFLLRNAHEEKA